jgi:hypothetical protein
MCLLVEGRTSTMAMGQRRELIDMDLSGLARQAGMPLQIVTITLNELVR